VTNVCRQYQSFQKSRNRSTRTMCLHKRARRSDVRSCLSPDGDAAWAGRQDAVRNPSPMLRHSTGFKLANQGVDTRSLQHYLGHKNIQHTVRYSELSPERFRDFWKD
jgi:site-specific recombinase XerD